MTELVWLAGAKADLHDIYKQVGFEKGERLLLEIDSALSLLRVFPEKSPRYFESIRRLLVGRKRNYGIFYSTSHSRIYVHAIADLRQDPEALKDLLRKRTNS